MPTPARRCPQSKRHSPGLVVHPQAPVQHNNDLRVSKKIFEGNTLTAGLYVAHFTES